MTAKDVALMAHLMRRPGDFDLDGCEVGPRRELDVVLEAAFPRVGADVDASVHSAIPHTREARHVGLPAAASSQLC